MKSCIISVCCIWGSGCLHLFSQDTFSIVAADSTTREVGSAGASCVDLFSAGFADASFLGDLLPDTGAINTQAAYIAPNQNAARARMRAGDTPAQIIDWITVNDINDDPTIRQYGITGFSSGQISAAGYTGINCTDYKNHITGSINGIYYAIQGNILLNQQVLDSMESGFRNAQGDLTCRMMAALQGANVVGADSRCTPDGTSSLFAFLKVAQPADSYGNPSFKISVKTRDNTHIEPIDSLQNLFNTLHSCQSTGIGGVDEHKMLTVFPNPAVDEIWLNADPSLMGSTYTILDSSGKQVMSGKIAEEKQRIEIRLFTGGTYIIQAGNNYSHQFIKN